MRQRESLEEGIRSSKVIRKEIQAATDALRARHAWLSHQDAIGFTIFATSAAAILALAGGYAVGRLPAWLVVPAAAFFMSLLHELEHDLIHRLYFKDHRWIYDALMIGVWLFRPSTINPFVRRDWHLHHHRVSGTETDLEERALGNGESWGLRRLLMTADSILSLALRPRTARAMLIGYAAAQKPRNARDFMSIRWRNRLSLAPLGNLYFAGWHLFLIVHGLAWLSPSLAARWVPDAVQGVMPTLDYLAVVLLMPNALRTFCLHLVSSNIHYYGDVEPKNVVQQTQVWDSPWVLPFQLFCFNFGSTHAIHHFVVQEPFYVRQLVAREAHAIMRAHGVRFNDFGTLRRMNRWSLEAHELPEPSLAV